MQSMDQVWKTKEGHYVTKLLFANNTWTLVSTRGTPVKNQVYVYNEVFPEQQIKDYWSKGYDITDMAYSSEGWLIVMSQGYDYNQRLKKIDINKGWDQQLITDYKREGFLLSSVCKSGSSWYLLFNKEDKITSSEYHLTDRFTPSRTIDEKWAQSFDFDKLIFIPAR